MKTLNLLNLTVALSLPPLLAGCDIEAKQGQSAAEKLGQESRLVDAELDDYRDKLLAMAYEAVTAMPVEPHIKDRSRHQEDVVAACLELGQPARALRYIEGIENWRKGAAYADLALYCAREGMTALAEEYLAEAGRIAQTDDEWRRDTVLIKMARVEAALGRPANAEALESEVTDEETGKLAVFEARFDESKTFEEHLEASDALVATSNFDLTRSALESYAQLFKRHYGDSERRALIEERVRGAWGELPILYRIEALERLAEFALEHRDKEKARELVDEARELYDAHQWPLQHGLGIVARIAKLAHHAGEEERAARDLELIMGRFDAEKTQIIDVFRTAALLPLAEAYQSIGRAKDALRVYRLALEEGSANLNARPRAENLARTLRSMALHDVEPDPELMARLSEVRDGLRQPW